MDGTRPHGSRLRLARQILGLTKATVAERIGITAPMIGLFENGDQNSSKYITRLAQVLEQPLGFFYAPVEGAVDATVAFRSLRTARERVKESVRAKAIVAVTNIDSKVHEHIRGGSTSWPDLSGISPEEAADAARKWLSLGAGHLRSDLLDILEPCGLRTYWYRDETERTVGMSFWWRDFPYVMLKNSGQSAERDNWTLAHELGHLLLHRHIPNVETDNTFNDEADSFARSFLLPRQEFVRAVGGRCTMELLLALKSSYRVSIQALVRSMHQYELITDSQYQFAFKRLTQKNMRRVEPGDRPSQSSKKLVSFADSAAQSFSSLERFCFDVLRVSTDLACEIAPPLSGFSILQSFYI